MADEENVTTDVANATNDVTDTSVAEDLHTNGTDSNMEKHVEKAIELAVAMEEVVHGDGNTDTTTNKDNESKNPNDDNDNDSEDADNQVEHIKQQTTLMEDMQTTLQQVDEKIDNFRDQKYSRTDCLCFFSFLLIFTTMAVLARGVSDLSFTQTFAIRTSLIERDEFVPWNDVGEKTFADGSTIGDIYLYLRSVAVPFLLNPDDGYRIQKQHSLLGGLRLKQIRMTPSECSRAEFNDCWQDEWFRGTVNYTYPNGSHAASFTYIDSEELDDQSWRGKYGSYPGGGFVVEFGLDRDAAVAAIDFLRDISWIDGGTRFVAMDFNTFNPSSGLHSTARIAWEMPSGSVYPNDEIKTWKFERYAGGDGVALAVFYVLFVIWVIGITAMETSSCWMMGCLKCGKHKGSYWNSKWKALDVANLVIFYLSIALFINNEVYRASVDMYRTDAFVSFRKLQYGLTYESYTTAVNGLLLWIKLFKYLAINKRLRFLFTMLSRSSADILMFVIVLFVFVIAFGTAGFLTFNSDVDDFRSYVFSMSNMVRFTLVDMDYPALTVSARLWGSLFYFAWSLLMLLILANVFIAILSEAYSQVQMELTEDDKISFGVGGVLERIREGIRQRITQNVQHDVIDEDHDGKISAAELAKATGVTEERAVEIIAAHDVDGDGQLDEEEFEKLKDQIIEERVQEEQLAAAASVGVGVLGLQRSTSDRAGRVPMISTKQYTELKQEMASVKDLLIAMLDQSKPGRQALRQRNIEPSKGHGRKASGVPQTPKRTSQVFS